MTRKNATIFATSALVVLLAAATAMANSYGPGQGGRNGSIYSQLAPEKQKAFTNIMKEFQDKAYTLRQDIWAKNAELNALSSNPNADPKYISGLVNDIKQLHIKLHNMRQTYGDRVEKEVGIRGFGPNFDNCLGGGPGMRGGMGSGMRGGMGYTNCPGPDYNGMQAGQGFGGRGGHGYHGRGGCGRF